MCFRKIFPCARDRTDPLIASKARVRDRDAGCNSDGGRNADPRSKWRPILVEQGGKVAPHHNPDEANLTKPSA
jgi:hypothetical protein